MEKAINIQTKESHFKNPIYKKQLPRTFKQQSGGKMFQQPTLLQNIPKNAIQFTATIHRILQCFLETPRFTAAVFLVAGQPASAARKGQGQTADQSLHCRKTARSQEKTLEGWAVASQLVLLQVIKFHIAEVNVILHRKLGQKGRLEPRITNGFHRKTDSRIPAWLLIPVITLMGNQTAWGGGRYRGKVYKCSLGWLHCSSTLGSHSWLQTCTSPGLSVF